MKLLFFLFISLKSYGEILYPCPYNASFQNEKDFIGNVEAVLKRLENKSFDAVSADDVKNAPCTNEAPTIGDVEKWINEEAKKSKSTKGEIEGLKLEDSRDLIKAFQALVRPKSIQHDYLLDKDVIVPRINVKEKYNIQNCDKVLCAVKKIFGNEVGPKLLYMKMKFGHNGSNIAFINSQNYTTKTIDPILSALQSLPQELFPIDDGKQLTLFTKGKKPKVYGSDDLTLANAVINIFDGWHNLPREEQTYTIAHEISHEIASAQELDESQKWLSFSKWEKTEVQSSSGESETVWTAKEKDNIISRYGENNPGEDFAESVSAYRYSADKFKKVSPEKYEYIKNNVFFGREFTTHFECKKASPLFEIVQNEIKNISQKELNDIDLKQSLEDCSLAISSELLTTLVKKENLRSCLQSSAYKQILQKKLAYSLEDKSLAKFLQINEEKLPKIPNDILRRPLDLVGQAISRDYENLLKNNSFLDPNDGPNKFCNNVKEVAILSKENFEKLPASLYDYENLPNFQHKACLETYQKSEKRPGPPSSFSNSVNKLLSLP